MAPPRALVSWSTGKDSAWALWETRCAGHYHVVGLLTTVTSAFARVAMHGVRGELLARQAAALGLPSTVVQLPWPCTNAEYEGALAQALAQAKASGISHVIYGDLYLSDIRAYREAQLAAYGLQAVFPLWGRNTAELARTMIRAGLEATLSCVDLARLDASFAGRRFDAELLAALPHSVDPCGENGEFHSFAHAGPMFSRPLAVAVGDRVERDGYAYADLLPASPA